MAEKKYIQSIERLSVIMDFIAVRGSAKLNEIGEVTGLKKTTAFGILQTLEHIGYVTRTNGGLEYTLGLNCMKLGLSYTSGVGIGNKIHQLLEELVQQINETAYFELAVGDRYYYLDYVVSTNPLKVVPDKDRFIDLPENSAVAKVFQNTDPDFCYATDLEEVEEGLNCFAIPFRSGGRQVACLAMTGPSYRFTKEKIEEAYKAYLDIMKRLGLECHL